jgi:hypothetical protein
MIDFDDDDDQGPAPGQGDSPTSGGTMSISQIATVLIVGGLAFWLGRNLPSEPVTVRSTNTVLTGRPFSWQPDPPDGEFVTDGTLPTGMHWDPERKLLHWLPSGEQIGDYSVAVLQSGAVNIRHEMRLSVISANRPPRFVTYPSTHIGTARQYLSPFTAHDPEGDPLTFRLVEKPRGMMLLRKQGEPVLRWLPDSLEGGPWSVTIELDDGSNTVSHQFTIAQPQVALEGELSEDVLLHFTFSGELADLTGNNSSAKIESAGIESDALILDGQSSFVEIPYSTNSGLHPSTPPLTVSAWFMTDAKAPREQTILATHHAGSGADGYYITVWPNGRLYWFLGAEDRNYIFLVAEGNYNDGRWHHVAGVWEDEEIRLYVDGMLQGDRNARGDLVYQHKAPFRVGHMAGLNPSKYHFNGAIDDVLVHRRALSPESIAALFKLGRSDGDQ